MDIWNFKKNGGHIEKKKKNKKAPRTLNMFVFSYLA